jgi:serine/threonine-protein kinase
MAEWPHIPEFEILAEIGRGALHVTYRARDTRLDREVTLKTPPHIPCSPSERELLHREAEVLAHLSHPRIARLLEAREHEGSEILVLEPLPASHLGMYIGRRTPNFRWIARTLAMVAETLDYVHEHGFLHGNLKPRNLLLRADRTPVLVGFNLSRPLDGPGVQPGSVLGTPGYLAPEQARGDIGLIGPRSDLHALGVVLYELCTGRPPFSAPNVAELLAQVTNRPPVPPSQYERRLPVALEAICLRCLAKAPEARHARARELAVALREFAESPRSE